MTSTIRRIGMLTSGGDAPGLNAVIRAVVRTAELEYGWKVLGIEGGFEGLLTPPRVRDMGMDAVRGLLPRGGTVLGSTNKGHFGLVEIDGVMQRDPRWLEELAANTRRLSLDALVIIGGEGSQGISGDLARYGVRAIGIPKTIDNDLWGTERTFGFDTALTVATEAIDRLHTTAASHDRVMVLEVMGRHVGWIALHAGIGGGADIILIPEIPFSIESVAAKVMARELMGSAFSIIVCAEGAVERGSTQMFQQATGTLGGIGSHVATQVAEQTGKDTRVVVLGHLQRGGVPTPYDRILATRFGAEAVHKLAEGRHGEVVVLRGDHIESLPMTHCAGKVKFVPTDDDLVRTARGLGMAFGDELLDPVTEEALERLQAAGGPPAAAGA